MNDVAKCAGPRCDRRDWCDRYVRRSGERQTWLVVPEHMQGRECPLMNGTAPLLTCESSAQISPCGLYRYELQRRWHGSGSMLVAIMLNPSTADAAQDDPTIRRLMRFASDWGHAALRVVNLFAFRATNPRELMRADDPIGPDNDSAILKAVTCAGSVTICAWGVGGKLLGRDLQVIALLVKHGVRVVYRLGTTKAGHPRHPLYVAASTKPELWHL